MRLGRLPGVGFRGSRPGKAAQCLECLEARRPDNFFRRTRGSRLGYPWPFTPTIGSMYENKVWTLVDLPDDRQAIENKWIFKKKTDADDNVTF